MPRYIDADAVCEKFKYSEFDSEEERTFNQAARYIIRHTPSADVALINRGEWNHLGEDEWCCSFCGEIITTEGSWDKPVKKFCYECGADMCGKENEV